MKNIIQRTVAGVLYQAQFALPTVTVKAGPLGLLHINGPAMTLTIANLTGARDAHGLAKTEWRVSRATLKTAHKSARTYLRTVREVLRPLYPETLAEVLVDLGFGSSSAIPRGRAAVVGILQQADAYFTAHPEHENAALNVTAARARTVAADLLAADTGAETKKAAMRTKAADRDAKLLVAREQLQTLLKELSVVLDPLSIEWDEFGFNRPGILATPDVPLNVIAMMTDPTTVEVKWDKAARAGAYRIYKKVVGVDADWVLVDTRTELDGKIEGLPAGATVEIAVSASNNGGESLKSAIATVVMPA